MMIGSTPIFLVLEDQLPGQMLLRVLQTRGVNRLPDGSALTTQIVRGADILREVERFQGSVDGVIVDYNVYGKLTGVDVAVQLRERQPDILLILFSGDVVSAQRHDLYRPGLFDVELAKPQPFEVVADHVVRLLNERRGITAVTPP